MPTRRQIVVKSKRLKAHKQHKLRRERKVHEKQTKTAVRLMSRQTRGGARPIDVPFSNAWGDEKSRILKKQLSLLEHAKSEKVQAALRRKERKKVNAERAKLGLPPLPTKGQLEKQKADEMSAHEEAMRAAMRASGSAEDESSDAQLASLNAQLAAAHVVVYVCDARDPAGSRSVELERHCVKAGRPMILLLNKFDLVTRDVLDGWLHALRSGPPPGMEGEGVPSDLNANPTWTSAVPFSARCARASVDLLVAAIAAAAQHHNLSKPTTALVVGPPRSGRGTIVKACLLGRASNSRGQIRLSQIVSVAEGTVRVGGGGRVGLEGKAAAQEGAVEGVLPPLLLKSRRIAPSSCKLWLALLLQQAPPTVRPKGEEATAGAAAAAAAVGLLRPELWGMMCCAYAVDQRLTEADLTPLSAVATKGMNDAAARAVSGSDRLTAAPALLSRIASKRNETVDDVARLVYMQWEGQAPSTPRWWVAPPAAASTAVQPSLAATREVEGAVCDYAYGKGGGWSKRFMALPLDSEIRQRADLSGFLFESLMRFLAAGGTAGMMDEDSDSEDEEEEEGEEDSDDEVEESEESDEEEEVPMAKARAKEAKACGGAGAKKMAVEAPTSTAKNGTKGGKNAGAGAVKPKAKGGKAAARGAGRR